MGNAPWDSTHDDLLSRTAPQVAEPSDSEVGRVWARVASSVDTSPAAHVAHTTRRRTWRAAATVLAGVVVVGTGSLAAAGVFSAHTGKGPIDAEDRRLGGPGERLDVGASDYGEVVADITSDIPFPNDEYRRVAVRDQAEDTSGARPGELTSSTGAIRSWVSDAAICAWSDQWAVATRAGDEAGRAEATAAIQQAPSWPSVTDIDPTPSGEVGITRTKNKDGTITLSDDDSPFFYLGSLGEAVEGTDVSAVVKLLRRYNGYCNPGLVDHIPRADSNYGLG